MISDNPNIYERANIKLLCTKLSHNVAIQYGRCSFEYTCIPSEVHHLLRYKTPQIGPKVSGRPYENGGCMPSPLFYYSRDSAKPQRVKRVFIQTIITVAYWVQCVDEARYQLKPSPRMDGSVHGILFSGGSTAVSRTSRLEWCLHNLLQTSHDLRLMSMFYYYMYWFLCSLRRLYLAHSTVRERVQSPNL